MISLSIISFLVNRDPCSVLQAQFAGYFGLRAQHLVSENGGRVSEYPRHSSPEQGSYGVGALCLNRRAGVGQLLPIPVTFETRPERPLSQERVNLLLLA